MGPDGTRCGSQVNREEAGTGNASPASVCDGAVSAATATRTSASRAGRTGIESPRNPNQDQAVPPGEQGV